MRNLFAACAIAALLGGCNATPPTPTSLPKPVTHVVTTVKTIAQVADNDFTKACATWGVAVGYYNNVSWAVSLALPTVAADASGVISAGNAICALPSGNVVQDLATLNALWVKIQAYTKLP